jgi:endonuclease YncB( thermonuclease family)
VGVLEAEGHTVEYTCGNCGAALMHADEIEVTGSSLSASVSPMARPYFLLRSLVAGLVLAAALCPLQVAPGAERPERQYTRDPIRTYRPRTPAEFFKQDAVRFERVRIDMNGLIYADGHSLSLYGAVLIPRNKICNPPDGVRWACGQRAFIALRNLLEGKSIACTFKHIAGPPKAACSVGDDDVAQVLLTQGWAELAEGVSEESYVEAHSSAQSRKAGIWADSPP